MQEAVGVALVTADTPLCDMALALLEEGVEEWAATTEAKLHGEVVLTDPLRFWTDLINAGQVEMALIVENEHAVGYDLSMPHAGWLMGCQTYLPLEERGRGLWKAANDLVLRRAADRGLAGLMFFSTLPFWPEKAKRAGFTAEKILIQADGTPVWLMRKEVV